MLYSNSLLIIIIILLLTKILRQFSEDIILVTRQILYFLKID